MSALVTLADVRVAAEHLVSTTDFLDLTNRAASRLYAKSATPGMLVELDAGTVLYDAVEDYHYLVVDMDAYDSVFAFRYVDGDTSCDDDIYDISPIETRYQQGGGGQNSFLDLGRLNVLTNDRYYRLPAAIDTGKDFTTETFKMLAKRAYVDVVDDTDIIPLLSLGSLKLAVLATAYEDENDLERANEYWMNAIREIESFSREFRGPQKVFIGTYDPAASEAVQTIN